MLLSGLGALFALVFNRVMDVGAREHEATLKDRSAMIESTHEVLANVVSGYVSEQFREAVETRLREFGAAVDSATHFAELEYQEDFRKRERRDKALVELSGALLKTTRAFRALTTFRLAAEDSTESLVNVLAQALAAREKFLSAREELLIIRAVRLEHLDLLRDYAALLTDIILDLRRRVASPGSDDSVRNDEVSYIELMRHYREKLIELDSEIGKRLSVFLAPKHREPISPVLPRTDRKA
jgi:hypothetical protein